MPRVYIGNQWQENALASVGSFNPSVIGTGIYCSVTAGNPAVVFGFTTQPYTVQFNFVAANFYVYGNAGANGGTIQPQIQLADGLFRDYGPLITVTGSGFIYAVTVNAPVLGAQFNVTSPISGGTAFLEIDCLLSS